MTKANIVGPQIQRLRGEMTQSDFVARLGVLGWHLSRGTLAKIESQVRGVSDAELYMLAKALRKSTDDLFPRDIGTIHDQLNQAEL